ncbi:MAG: MipA/OmpV family protein, partial [Aquabacterium sp.]|nr:MipA/OmpV family protein [Aquabacterium sp.]
MTHPPCPGIPHPGCGHSTATRLAIGAAAGLLAWAGAAQAQGAASGLPLWELGVLSAGITQQAYPGSDQQVRRATLLPFGIYRGRLLRADGETAGLRAVKTDNFELDIGFAGSFGAGRQGVDARRGMPRLGTL